MPSPSPLSCRLGPARRRRCSDLNRQQNRAVSPARFRSPRLPSPFAVARSSKQPTNEVRRHRNRTWLRRPRARRQRSGRRWKSRLCATPCRRVAVPPRTPRPPESASLRDPSLLVLAPTPLALDPENLPVHLSVTLKLAQKASFKVTPFATCALTARRPPPDGYAAHALRCPPLRPLGQVGGGGDDAFSLRCHRMYAPG